MHSGEILSNKNQKQKGGLYMHKIIVAVIVVVAVVVVAAVVAKKKKQ